MPLHVPARMQQPLSARFATLAARLRRDPMPVVGFAALWSGAALLAYLAVGLSLPVTLAGLLVAVLAGMAVIWRVSPAVTRAAIRHRALIGLAAGLAALVVYDTIRFAGAALDPSPYDPLEALRGFGRALVGARASPARQFAAGMAFHAVNGVMFGLGFVGLVAGSPSRSRTSWAMRGVAWALFLEMFQLSLYPKWLGIVFVQEFTYIATAAHVGYGLVLGLVSRRLLQEVR